MQNRHFEHLILSPSNSLLVEISIYLFIFFNHHFPVLNILDFPFTNKSLNFAKHKRTP